MNIRQKYYQFFNNSVIPTIFNNPLYLILFVSDKCWTSCNHCWYNDQWKKSHLQNRKPLTFDELEKVSKSIKKLKFLSITGGEAFLRNDIVELVKMFNSNIKLTKFDIPTSGFETDLIINKTEAILKNITNVPFRVDVSLDGLRDTHDSIRNRKGTFDNALQTIQSLRKLKSKYHNLDVSIITTIQNDNQNEIKELSEVVGTILPDGEWMVNITRGDTRQSDAKSNSLESYLYAGNQIEKRISERSYSGDNAYIHGKWLTAKNIVRRKIIAKIMTESYPGGGCTAGSLITVIYNDGSVYPCEMLNREFGNLRDYDYNLPSIINSSKAKIIRNEIQESNCICTHECFLSMNILIQPAQIVQLIKERARLK